MEVSDWMTHCPDLREEPAVLNVYSVGLYTFILLIPLLSTLRHTPWQALQKPEPLLEIGSCESSPQRESFYTEVYNLIQENAFISV